MNEREPQSMEPLLTTAEGAEILRCSTRTMLRRIQSGKLRAVQIGGRYLLRREDVAEFIRKSLTSKSQKNLRKPQLEALSSAALSTNVRNCP
jgi:excisionase family DNA binding protein